MPWHRGETAMHTLLSLPPRNNPTTPGLHPRYGPRMSAAPLIALAAADEQGRAWATVWGGNAGTAGIVAPNVLGVRSKVSAHDPVLGALWGPKEGRRVVKPGDPGERLVAGLAIDLETRDRVKFAGRMMVGAAEEEGGVRDVQVGIEVRESMGNCPKYINRRTVVPRETMEPTIESEALPLVPRAVEMIRGADMFFVASGAEGKMDSNYRGGPPGFVRIARNDEGGVELVYPEYSGNRLYQTLGNLKVNPAIGITIVDFETSDVLYLTGTSTILIGPAASSLLQHTTLAVKATITSARLVSGGLPFHAAGPVPGAPDYSPYNPPVRPLLTEKSLPFASPQRTTTATFLRREVLSPTVARITLRLSPDSNNNNSGGGGEVPSWKSGEAITLDFSGELDNGYAHMRDEDPLSLNDDFVRTFTVSSPAPSSPGVQKKGAPVEVEITVRKHGPATGLLFRWNPRAELTLPVLGFGGTDGFLIPVPAPGSGSPDQEGPLSVFVAGGVGITPILAQAGAVLSSAGQLRVLWGLRAEDLPFATDVLSRVPGLAAVTTLFVSGAGGQTTAADEEKLGAAGARVEKRRIGEADVRGAGGADADGSGRRRKFYVCAGQGMTGAVLGWLEGEDVVTESFNY
ncbi:related to oxidoreductase, FAD-binding [Cephalotrichum gorgonifer]|uniref:Related to oxidoreductase, FAD-binding n=1 Tax=Cephalotrichum gorgonifer TaxID=2041049 RepID=A0AAE8N2S7_9PEZI|nr:related to oxidoreductase, FAD-binding [Cephalotrichum gorgonifer]